MRDSPAAEVRYMKILIALAALLLINTSAFAQNSAPIVPAAWEVKASRVSNVRPEYLREIAEIRETTVSAAALEDRAFQLINEVRESKGLPHLVWNDDLAKLARFHSRHMATEKFFSHRDGEGLMVNDRADKFGLEDWRAIGENIAFNRGFDDPVKTAVENWMDSRGHRENLLGPDWSESAIGLAIAADGSYYFTQVFLLKK